ncbi:MAG: energy transducer TonB [Rhodospirillaceae bacterium]|nr:energy transducer TonB [Rhodospirillaceae bacterium]
MTAPGRHRWAACLGAAVLVHAGVVMAALWPADRPGLAGGGGGGEGGYAVSLGGGEGAAWAAAASAGPDMEAAVETADAAPAPPTPVAPPAPMAPPDPMELAPTQDEAAPVAPFPVAAGPVETVGDGDPMLTSVPPPPDLSVVREAAEPASLDVAIESPAEAVDLAEPAEVPVEEPDMALEPVVETAVSLPPPAAPAAEAVPAQVAAAPDVEAAAGAEPLTGEVDLLDDAMAVPPLPVIAEPSVEIPPRPTRRPTPPERPEPVLPQAVQIASAPQPAPETLGAPPAPDDGGGVALDTGSDAPAGLPGEGAGTGPGTDEGAGGGIGGGVGGGISPNYLASLQAWLERHRDYPTRARRLAQEGTALLYFSMDRNGRVLEARLAQSSGYDLLDQAVMEMIARADPLPPMPQEMAQARLELVVPVQFSLR